MLYFHLSGVNLVLCPPFCFFFFLQGRCLHLCQVDVNDFLIFCKKWCESYVQIWNMGKLHRQFGIIVLAKVCHLEITSTYREIKEEKIVFLNDITLQSYQKEEKCILHILRNLPCLEVPFIK